MKYILSSFSLVLVMLIVSSCSYSESAFYLDANGLTVKAKDWVVVGTVGELNGVNYVAVNDSSSRAILGGIPNDSVQFVTTLMTDMSWLFTSDIALKWNDILNVSDWDVSHVTNMSGMFARTSSFNDNISDWNLGDSTNTNLMLYQAEAFKQEVSYLIPIRAPLETTKFFPKGIRNLDSLRLFGWPSSVNFETYLKANYDSISPKTSDRLSNEKIITSFFNKTKDLPGGYIVNESVINHPQSIYLHQYFENDISLSTINFEDEKDIQTILLVKFPKMEIQIAKALLENQYVLSPSWWTEWSDGSPINKWVMYNPNVDDMKSFEGYLIIQEQDFTVILTLTSWTYMGC